MKLLIITLQCLGIFKQQTSFSQVLEFYKRVDCCLSQNSRKLMYSLLLKTEEVVSVIDNLSSVWVCVKTYGTGFFTNNSSNSKYSAQETVLFLHNAISKFMLSGIRMLMYLLHVKECTAMFFPIFEIVHVPLLNGSAIFPRTSFKRLFEPFSNVFLIIYF